MYLVKKNPVPDLKRTVWTVCNHLGSSGVAMTVRLLMHSESSPQFFSNSTFVTPSTHQGTDYHISHAVTQLRPK